MPPDRRRRQRLERVFPTTPGAVPVRLFAAELRRLLAATGAPTQAQLEARSGIPSRTIYRILNEIDRSVSFDVADALLTALDAVGLWHQPPLDQFLEPPPPKETLLNPITFEQDAARQSALARRTPGKARA
jgi:Cro/C1-type HTH DNA-binding domain